MARAKTDESSIRGAVVEDVRPWGKFRAYPHQGAGSLKIITVNPGCRLSLQYHNRRAEFWVVLDAGLEITVGDRIWSPEPGEEIYIPKGAPHRLRNAGTTPARVMELWLGRSGESDIVRVEDDYRRK